MKLHNTAIDRIVYIFENYGGHSTHTKLRAKLDELDFTPYEKKTGGQEIILVLTEDYLEQLNPVKK